MGKAIRTGFGVKMRKVMKKNSVGTKIPNYEFKNTLIKHSKPMKEELAKGF